MSKIIKLPMKRDAINRAKTDKPVTNLRFEFVRTKWTAFPIEIAEVPYNGDKEDYGNIHAESDAIGFCFEIPLNYKLDPKELPDEVVDVCISHGVKDDDLTAIHMFVNAALRKENPLRLIRKWCNRHQLFEKVGSECVGL